MGKDNQPNIKLWFSEIWHKSIFHKWWLKMLCMAYVVHGDISSLWVKILWKKTPLVILCPHSNARNENAAGYTFNWPRINKWPGDQSVMSWTSQPFSVSLRCGGERRKKWEMGRLLCIVSIPVDSSLCFIGMV